MTMLGSISVRHEHQGYNKLQLLINMGLFDGAAQKEWAVFPWREDMQKNIDLFT